MSTISLTKASATMARRGTWHRLLHAPLALTALILLFGIVLATLAAPLLTSYDPNVGILADALATPGPNHWLGADSAGRDIFARLLFGGRVTLGAAALALTVATVVGVLTGLFAGFYGKWFDVFSEWTTSLVMALPTIMLLLAVRAAVGNILWISMVVLGLHLAPGFHRLTRTIVVGVRHELYVDAARVSGLSDVRIVLRHVLAAVRAPIIINAALTAVVAIGVQSGLEFLGLANTQIASWGTMLNEAMVNLYVAPALMLWPGIALGIVNVALILFGNGLRDALEDRPAAQGGKKRTTAAALAAAAAQDTEGERVSALVPDAVLRVEGLRIGYPSADGISTVVHGVDLAVRPGEVLGLVGESGSGKTQTAWSVLDLLPSEAMILGGSITIDGQDRAKLPAGRRRALLGNTLAYIPQEPMSNLDPSFTVGQQLTLPLRRTMGMSRGEAKAKALALLERVGIADPERTFNSYPHQISGGMAQRVLIAGAVSCEPKVLVADEPTTALDVTVQAEVLDLLRSLQQERGMAILLVTHNFGVVADICDRVAVMQHGRIVEAGDVAEIFAAPQHPYTRMLLGSLLHEREPRTRLVDSEQPLEASV
ncbi:dipeptide/oligopeptide/nickel ABC transporter permease/ATP-binding protein [Arthrobacter sp. BF1]|uniref:dipeptide/oligopeptide/nickel ABC transporter permease/ATP-binding protein n=1 Tax=Arthrobacter sp. BF1 TaxID=2821145 RepID=UPI001C4FD455|nr:dipeptide/oligopeptide/nickel ABC transporter permease/ATP-binding protein [Arthrobacter sp. BF1]